MKKVKNYLVSLAVALGAFLITGTVSAASANNFDIICNPTSIESGNNATCYLVAQIDGASGIYGVTTKVVTMKHLKLYTGDGTSGVHGYTGTSKAEYRTNGQTSGFVSGLTCTTSGELFCANFVSTGTTNTILPNTGTAVPGVTDSKAEYNGYTTIGFFQVTLDDSATTKDCGELCVSVRYAESAAFLADDEKISAGTTGKNACDEIKPIISGEVSTTETPETGAFASYAVLAAGAFIAVSAIAIAKKHNKFYRV